jgi:hypothetical protein
LVRSQVESLVTSRARKQTTRENQSQEIVIRAWCVAGYIYKQQRSYEQMPTITK